MYGYIFQSQVVGEPIAELRVVGEPSQSCWSLQVDTVFNEKTSPSVGINFSFPTILWKQIFVSSSPSVGNEFLFPIYGNEFLFPPRKRTSSGRTYCSLEKCTATFFPSKCTGTFFNHE